MLKVTITSAIALTSSQKKILVDAVEKKYGQTEIVEVVDPLVLGGVKVRIGSEQIDATVAYRVQQVREQLS